jgi:hypothetical protein
MRCFAGGGIAPLEEHLGADDDGTADRQVEVLGGIGTVCDMATYTRLRQRLIPGRLLVCAEMRERNYSAVLGSKGNPWARAARARPAGMSCSSANP